MPNHPSQPSDASTPVSEIVGQPTAVVGSAEANIGIPKLSPAEYDSLLADFNRIAQNADAELEDSDD